MNIFAHNDNTYTMKYEYEHNKNRSTGCHFNAVLQHVTTIGNSIAKIRQSCDCIIFIMGTYVWKDGLNIEMGNNYNQAINLVITG